VVLSISGELFRCNTVELLLAGSCLFLHLQVIDHKVNLLLSVHILHELLQLDNVLLLLRDRIKLVVVPICLS